MDSLQKLENKKGSKNMKVYKILGTAFNTMDITDKVRLEIAGNKWGLEIHFQGREMLVKANLSALNRLRWKMLPELRQVLDMCRMAATI